MTKGYNFELWHSVEKESLKVTIIEENGFLTGKSDKQGFFLKSSRRESRSSYQISSDNPQKDNFHKSTFRLTDATLSDRKLIGWEFSSHYYPQK